MKKLSILCILICMLFLSSCEGLTLAFLDSIGNSNETENGFFEKSEDLSYSEAKAQSGFFVMKDENSFVPLQEDMLFFNPHPATYNDNIFFTDAKNENWYYNEKDAAKSGILIEKGYTLIDRLFAK